jgi:hypothetical protein
LAAAASGGAGEEEDLDDLLQVGSQQEQEAPALLLHACGPLCLPCQAIDVCLHPTTLQHLGISGEDAPGGAHAPMPAAAPPPLPLALQPSGSSLDSLAGPGLRNETGEYNCFLNVIIQCLWRCAEFKREVRCRFRPPCTCLAAFVCHTLQRPERVLTIHAHWPWLS